MSLKKFELEIEVLSIHRISVFAATAEEAWGRGQGMKWDEIKEGYRDDYETRMVGLRREKLSRMYKE